MRHGRIKPVKYAIEGVQVMQHVALSGESLAEASLFASRYHCSAVADLNTELLMKHLLGLLTRQVRELRMLNELKNIRSARECVLVFVHNQVDAAGYIQWPGAGEGPISANVALASDYI